MFFPWSRFEGHLSLWGGGRADRGFSRGHWSLEGAEVLRAVMGERRPAAFASLSRFGRILRFLRACCERSRRRRELAGLSDRLLEDVGLCRLLVERETRKWPWQD